MKKQQSGFTLIELIMVIVVLGILSVVAAPKFLDVSRDAKIATIEGLAGAIKTSVTFARSKAMINGVDKEYDNIVADNGENIELYNGYPRAYWSIAFEHLLNIDIDPDFENNGYNKCPNEWCYVDREVMGLGTREGNGVIAIYPKGHSYFGKRKGDMCRVTYINDEEGQEGYVTIDTEDC